MSKNILTQYAPASAEASVSAVSMEQVMLVGAAVMSAEAVVEAVSHDISEMQDVAAGLESLTADISATMENGGLEPQAAVFMQHGLDAQLSRLGASAEGLTPAMESFGGATTREEATQVSMEGIGDTLKKIWNAIKAAVQKSMKAIADFFSKLFGGIEKVITKLEEVVKDAKKLDKQELKKDAELKVPAAETLRFGGKVDGKSIAKGVDALAKNVDTVTGDYTKQISKQMAKMMDVIDELNNLDNDEKMDEVLDGLVNGQDFDSAKITSEKDLMSGDKVVVAEVETKGKLLIGGGLGIKVSESARALDSKDTTVAPLTGSEVAAIAGTVLGALKKIKDGEKAINKIADGRDKATKALEKAVKSGNESVWGSVKARVMLRAVEHEFGKPVRQISSHTFSVARAVISLAERNAGLYKDKK